MTRFPRSKPFYVLHLDNFFTTCKLYQRLYELGIGANGTAKAGSGIPKELAYLRDAMTKQNNHGEWFNYVVGSVNCIAFCDSASKAMMTTVHDPTMEEYTYFDRIKRPGASLKLAVDAETANAANSINAAKFTCPAPSANSAPPVNSVLFTHPAPPANSAFSTNSALPTHPAPPANSAFSTNSTHPAHPAPPANSTCPTCLTPSDNSSQQYIRKLYALEHYNKEMGGSDNHAKLNSYYSVSRHYHRRNWLSLFYLSIDAAVTNAYILYKLGSTNKKLSHAQFQEEIAQSLLRGPGAILRQRPPRPPQAPCNLHTKSVLKDSYKGHSWVKGDHYRRCELCNPAPKRGRPRKALQEMSINAPNKGKASRKGLRQTIWSCSNCGIPICHNSRCWARHLAFP